MTLLQLPYFIKEPKLIIVLELFLQLKIRQKLITLELLQLLADAANLAAKTSDQRFYELKNFLLLEIVINYPESILKIESHIAHEYRVISKVGVSTYHTPYLKIFVERTLVAPFSGCYRLNSAFALLKAYFEDDTEVFKQLVQLTKIGVNNKPYNVADVINLDKYK